MEKLIWSLAQALIIFLKYSGLILSGEFFQNPRQQEVPPALVYSGVSGLIFKKPGRDGRLKQLSFSKV
jgi:hypothetical protein